MDIVTADNALQQTLVNVGGLTEVRDTQGILLGYFSPASHKSAEAYVQAASHFDSAEMQRRKSSEEAGRTTDDVLKRIASLGQ